MAADGDQSQTGTTHPSAALHKNPAANSSLLVSTALISGHSKMHIFTQLTLSPQLTGNRASENSSYTATGLIQGKYDGQHTPPPSFYKGQPERYWFFPTQMRLSVP